MMTLNRSATVAFLSFALVGCDCDVAVYQLNPTIQGSITISYLSSEEVVAQIVDASGTAARDDIGCSLGYELVYRNLAPEPDASVQLNIGCGESSGVGSLPFYLDATAETFELLDLNDAVVGDSRRIPATLGGHWAEAILVVTRAEGEYRGTPDGPTDDYLREFTLTAVFDCATAPNATCDYRIELELEGRQVAEDFVGQCGITPDE